VKRIVVLVPELLGVGGIQEASRLTAQAAAALASCYGWDLAVFSLNDPRGRHNLPLPCGGAIPFRGFGRAKICFLLAALTAARKTGGIILAAHPNLAVPATWIRRIAPRLRVVTICHGVEVWNPISRRRRRALAGSDLVLAPSRFTLEKLSAVQCAPLEKLRLLPWPLNPTFLAMAAQRTLPLPPGFPAGCVLLTVGRWAASERYKGLDELIRALAILRPALQNLSLVAIGSGDDLARLRRMANELGLRDCVHFVERLSRDEIAACYAHAQIFVLPSTGEGFGIVFLEAMAFAKPIVAAAFGGAKDLVEHDVNGLLIAPHDTAGLAQAIEALVRDDALRARLGSRGAEIVRARYDFKSFQDRLEGLLQECGLE